MNIKYLDDVRTQELINEVKARIADIDVDIATIENLGVVKPDGMSVLVKADGTIYTNIWIGTNAEYESQKYKIPYGTIIFITDDDGQSQGESFIVNGVKIVPWATGTNAEIDAMLTGAEQGKINLSDYWSVGDERKVHLSSIAVGDAFRRGEEEQDVIYVLMNEGYENQEGISFVVGQKDCLLSEAIMCSQNSQDYDLWHSWKGTSIRNELNTNYYNAIPNYLKSHLKDINITTANSDGTALDVTVDKIALFAEKEITGTKTACYEIEAEALSQIDYYTLSSRRIKTKDGSASVWWERSPYYKILSHFGTIHPNGTANAASGAWYNIGVAPFMCI